MLGSVDIGDASRRGEGSALSVEIHSDPVDRVTHFVYDQRNIDVANPTRSVSARSVVGVSYTRDQSEASVVYDRRYEMSFLCR